MTWSDGRQYKGEWLKGKQHGEGEEILKRGEKPKKGTWTNGTLVKYSN